MKRLARSAVGWGPWLGTALGVLALVVSLPRMAHATPNHAHLHYHIGVRAYAGARHAAVLYQEASGEGLDSALALEDGRDMERLATEILDYVDRLEKVMSPREKETIAGEVAAMKEHGLAARQLSAELAGWIESASAAPGEGVGPAPLPRELCERMAGRARVLFAEFSFILARHKQAERKLSIPVPPDPPAP